MTTRGACERGNQQSDRNGGESTNNNMIATSYLLVKKAETERAARQQRN